MLRRWVRFCLGKTRRTYYTLSSLRESKQPLYRPLEPELERAFQNEIEAIMRCFGTADAQEAIVAFREKRPPAFQGK